MARSRNIKPGFFSNEDLAECSPFARLFFIGLWTIADREGRLEYRPKKIKVEVLPYDDCEIKTLVEELRLKGFLIVYSANGNNYLQIVNFVKHQNPHMKEQPSTIPAPDLHQTCTVQAHLNPESLSLNPESMNLESPSLNPDTSETNLAMADPGGAITFEEFWNAYPKPSGRAAAKTEYLKTLAQGNVDHAAIIIGCRKYAAFYQNGGVEYRYIPNPAKWLESEGWRHDYRLPDKASQPGASYGDKLFAAAALTRPHDSD